MPVDEANIDTLLTKGRLKDEEVNTQRRAIRVFMTNLEGIREETIPDPTESEPDRTKTIKPKDKALGGELSTARRQEIYDKCVADAVTLNI